MSSSWSQCVSQFLLCFDFGALDVELNFLARTETVSLKSCICYALSFSNVKMMKEQEWLSNM